MRKSTRRYLLAVLGLMTLLAVGCSGPAEQSIVVTYSVPDGLEGEVRFISATGTQRHVLTVSGSGRQAIVVAPGTYSVGTSTVERRNDVDTLWEIYQADVSATQVDVAAGRDKTINIAYRLAAEREVDRVILDPSEAITNITASGVTFSVAGSDGERLDVGDLVVVKGGELSPAQVRALATQSTDSGDWCGFTDEPIFEFVVVDGSQTADDRWDFEAVRATLADMFTSALDVSVSCHIPSFQTSLSETISLEAKADSGPIRWKGEGSVSVGADLTLIDTTIDLTLSGQTRRVWFGSIPDDFRPLAIPSGGCVYGLGTLCQNTMVITTLDVGFDASSVELGASLSGEAKGSLELPYFKVPTPIGVTIGLKFGASLAMHADVAVSNDGGPVALTVAYQNKLGDNAFGSFTRDVYGEDRMPAFGLEGRDITGGFGVQANIAPLILTVGDPFDIAYAYASLGATADAGIRFGGNPNYEADDFPWGGTVQAYAGAGLGIARGLWSRQSDDDQRESEGAETAIVFAYGAQTSFPFGPTWSFGPSKIGIFGYQEASELISVRFGPEGEPLTAYSLDYLYETVFPLRDQAFTVSARANGVDFSADATGSCTLHRTASGFAVLDLRALEVCEVVLSVRQVTDAAPVAAIEGPAEVRVGADAVFDASGSYDPDGGSITQYAFTASDSSSGPRELAVWSTRYDRVGSEEVCVTVQDDEGDRSSSACHTFDVVPLDSSGPDLEILSLSIFADGERLSVDTSQTVFFGVAYDYSSISVDAVIANNGLLLDEGAIFDVGLYEGQATLDYDESLNVGSDPSLYGASLRIDPGDLSPGLHEVALRIDFRDHISETREDNNQVVFLIDVGLPPAPIADFECTTSGRTASCSDTTVASEPLASRTWDFGDDTGSSSANPTHTYAAYETYEVSLRVEDAYGQQDSVLKDVSITRPTYELSVGRVGNGTGTINSDGGEISCGLDCAAALPAGTPISLSAAPAADAVFIEWIGCPNPTESTCSFDLDAPLALDARFEPATYPLSVTVEGAGSVTADGATFTCTDQCSDDVPYGTSVLLTPTPDEGAEFLQWSGCPDAIGSQCSARLDAPTTVVATFSEPQVDDTLPNLVLGGAKIEPQRPIAGDMIEFCITWGNNGGSAVQTPDDGGTTVARSYLDNDLDPTARFSNAIWFVDIDAGWSWEECVNPFGRDNPAPAGSYTIYTYTDADGEVVESSEGDNRLVFTFAVGAAQ